MTGDIRYLGHGAIVDATREGGGRIVGAFTYTKTPAPVEVMQSDLQVTAARTHGQLSDLARHPTPERCELMIRALADVSAQVYRLLAELQRQ